jgi:transposase
MLAEEDDVEIHALSARGWSVSAIARHTGRDRKTIRRYLTGDGGRQRRMPAPSSLEPWRGYIAARFVDDPHLPAVALLDELLAAGFRRSYQRLVRELRRTELRPVCLVCEQMSSGTWPGRCTRSSSPFTAPRGSGAWTGWRLR